ncbi:glycerol-3-phosphate dehydrogenase [Coraliomargarita sinensis]|uniref:Glycerol-3-phosphate dehydrogenase [NAD(P)+] n=1 Tax=Coraliomargarita sinensis TaxID=2174842 RepID=A0A317ZCV7_9BACT|nr:NAD(P)H-dependent glycerol-3-phosphate dehydrogenase [Coraliomargarita sinensis]PXA02946.1 glycerol-3-phosphate dehydrogenase [Coraliomargarita sinensis]
MNCCILGAGAWGTAMALHLDRCGHSVTLVPRRMEHALSIASSRENSDYLPGYKLPHRIQIGYEIGPVLMEADVVFFACPSKAIRDLAGKVRPHLEAARQLKLCLVMCKGLELDSFKAPAEILEESLPGLHCGVLSGPTYAGEVAAGQPTAVVLALPRGLEDGNRYQEAFSNSSMRCYLSHDVRGTELGGTLKNIYAIGSGICDGLKLGDNAKAAYLTRSLNELLALGTSLGGQADTFYGLSGFGDLIATCTGAWSRNRTFGEKVGEGEAPESIIENQKTVVEGYRATECLYRYCRQQKIDAPILGTIHAVLYEALNPEEGIQALMRRNLKAE